MKLRKVAKWILISLGIILVSLSAWGWLVTYHPAEVQSEPIICSDQTPILSPGQKLKVLNWNVQFMAGKDYVFYYDLPDNSGPDEGPSPEDITETFNEVSRIIQDEKPDIILLQEVDDGAKRTDYEDQLARLLSLLPEEYSCYTAAFEWKASFVPHPRIMGAVGLKIAIISKYRITQATRYQLPLMPQPVTREFNLKRAVLEVHMPVENATDFVVLNTHLEAFAQGTDVLEKQVNQVESILENLTQEGYPWIIGGDFNSLPPGKAYGLLQEEQKKYYSQETEIEPLFEKYQTVPSLSEVNSPDCEQWFTHFPNDPGVGKPDRTIDYIFLANNITLGKHCVRQYDTLTISDHLPVLAEFELPSSPE